MFERDLKEMTKVIDKRDAETTREANLIPVFTFFMGSLACNGCPMLCYRNFETICYIGGPYSSWIIGDYHSLKVYKYQPVNVEIHIVENLKES